MTYNLPTYILKAGLVILNNDNPTLQDLDGYDLEHDDWNDLYDIEKTQQGTTHKCEKLYNQRYKWNHNT